MSQHKVRAIVTPVGKTIPTALGVNHLYVLACISYDGKVYCHDRAPRFTVQCEDILESSAEYSGDILERSWWDDYPVFELSF